MNKPAATDASDASDDVADRTAHSRAHHQEAVGTISARTRRSRTASPFHPSSSSLPFLFPLLVALCLTSSSSGATWSWTTLLVTGATAPSLHFPEAGQAQNASFSPRSKGCLVVINDNLMMAGGYAGMSSSYSNDVYRFYSGTEGWSQNVAQTSFTPRFGHACFAFGGGVFLVGGTDGSSSLNDVWTTADTGNNWRAQGNAAWSPRTYPSVVVNGDTAWLTGGTGTDFDLWRSKDGLNWESVASSGSVPTARFTAAWSMIGTTMWLAGGYYDGALSDVYSFDPTTLVWSTGPSMPTTGNDGVAVTYGGHTMHNGQIVVLGGAAGGGGRPPNAPADLPDATEIFAFDGTSWARGPLSPMFPVAWPMVASFRSSLIVTGGDTGPSGFYNEVFVSDSTYLTPGAGEGSDGGAGGAGGGTTSGGGTSGGTTGGAGSGTTSGGSGTTIGGGVSGGGSTPGGGEPPGGTLGGAAGGIISGGATGGSTDSGSGGANGATGAGAGGGTVDGIPTNGGGSGSGSEIDPVTGLPLTGPGSGVPGSTSKSSSGSSNTIAIAVGVSVGVAALLAICLLWFCCARARKRAREDAASHNTSLHNHPGPGGGDLEKGSGNWLNTAFDKHKKSATMAGAAGGAGAGAYDIAPPTAQHSRNSSSEYIQAPIAAPATAAAVGMAGAGANRSAAYGAHPAPASTGAPRNLSTHAPSSGVGVPAAAIGAAAVGAGAGAALAASQMHGRNAAVPIAAGGGPAAVHQPVTGLASSGAAAPAPPSQQLNQQHQRQYSNVPAPPSVSLPMAAGAAAAGVGVGAGLLTANAAGGQRAISPRHAAAVPPASTAAAAAPAHAPAHAPAQLFIPSAPPAALPMPPATNPSAAAAAAPIAAAAAAVPLARSEQRPPVPPRPTGEILHGSNAALASPMPTVYSYDTMQSSALGRGSVASGGMQSPPDGMTYSPVVNEQDYQYTVSYDRIHNPAASSSVSRASMMDQAPLSSVRTGAGLMPAAALGGAAAGMHFSAHPDSTEDDDSPEDQLPPVIVVSSAEPTDSDGSSRYSRELGAPLHAPLVSGMTTGGGSALQPHSRNNSQPKQVGFASNTVSPNASSRSISTGLGGGGLGTSPRSSSDGLSRPSSSSRFQVHHLPASFLVTAEDIQIEREVGRGGFGTVYKARFRGVDAAVKMLRANDSREMMRSFERELSIMCSVHNNRLVQCYGACKDPESPFIIMEWMPRGSLHACLHSAEGKQSYITMEKRLTMAIEIFEGLTFMHLSRPPILHGDLTSSNVLVDRSWNVKLADFGWSQLVAHNTSSSLASFRSGFTDSMALGGTLAYLPPESLGEEVVLPNTSQDLYSAGVVLWELFTGQVPWSGLTFPQILAQVGMYKKSLPMLSSIPAPIQAILKPLFHADSKARPSAQQVLEQLKSVHPKLMVDVDRKMSVAAATAISSTYV